MAKRKTTRGFKPEGGADFGPALRLNKSGRLVEWGGAARIDVGNRDDPSVTDRRRSVRGARRRDALADLEARSVITKRQRDAAEQFLEDLSIAHGGTASDGLGGFSPAGPRAGLPERQVAAIVRINEVRHLLGINVGTVFWWVVFENRSLTDFEAEHCLRNGTATEMLQDALQALDEHYHRASLRKRA